MIFPPIYLMISPEYIVSFDYKKRNERKIRLIYRGYCDAYKTRTRHFPNFEPIIVFVKDRRGVLPQNFLENILEL